MRTLRHPFILMCTGLALWLGLAAIYDLIVLTAAPLLPVLVWMLP